MSGLASEDYHSAKRPKTGAKTTERDAKTSHFEPPFKVGIEDFCRLSEFDPPTSNSAGQKTKRRAGSSPG